MTTTPHHINGRMPSDLVAAMESGNLDDQQLREIVRIEAGRLGLTLDQAIELAQENRLPKTAAGSDLQLRILMLLS